jgi:4-hydroxybenzoate polyprenyltransferase
VRNPPARLRTYLALSRTPHALLDLAAPAVAALMWTDGFHPPEVTALGLLTVFAAYTAVYALNDIIDREADRRKVLAGYREAGGYLDAVLVRHPLARGLLTTRQALAWALSWAAVAAAGSLVLNPVCLVLFMGGFAAEIAYCRLACVSPWRALLSGVVKTLGPLAAVLVVDPSPSPLPFALLGLWVFLVEIGGQNVPSDWTDLEEDRKLGAATIPARLGEATAAVLALAARAHRLELAAMSLAAGVALLLLPAARLAACRRRDAVFRLFNRASAYPAALLAAMVAKLLLL